MPRKSPISFSRAIGIISEKKNEALRELDITKSCWYHENFIRTISESGYHIVLSGDEFVFHLSQSLDN